LHQYNYPSALVAFQKITASSKRLVKIWQILPASTWESVSQL